MKQWAFAIVFLTACGSSTPGPPPPPTCEAGQTSCAGICVDTSSDARQCGACGHDCLGGACSNGACSAVTFFQGADLTTGPPPWGIAVDAANVYFTELTTLQTKIDGAVYRCPKRSCVLGDPTVLADKQPYAREVASDGKDVYWFINPANPTPPKLARCSVLGCGGAPETFADGTSGFTILFAGDRVWWSNWSGIASGSTVLWCNAGTVCNAANPFVANQIGGFGLAIAGNTVFWTDAPAMASNGPPLGSVHACSLADACTQDQTLAAAVDRPYDVASDEANVYWISGGGRYLMSCSASGCAGPPRVLFDDRGENDILGLALDGPNVYFTAIEGVLRCPKTGCGGAPTVLVKAEGLTRMARLAVDDIAVYFTDYGTGTVSRIAK